MLSCVIIAKNTASSIQKTIESVRFADEIIVVDDDSEDATGEIAKKNGARVINHSLDNFSQQRNYGMTQAKGDWILFVDTDEIVTQDLQSEIVNLVQTQNSNVKTQINNPNPVTNNHKQVTSNQKPEICEAYYIKRRDYFWGTELKYGETLTARTKGFIRLVRKRAGIWRGAVHEEFVTDKKVGSLAGFIKHYPHPTIAEFLQSINIYSTLRTKELYKSKRRSTFPKILFFPPIKFVYTYVLLLGFLDGPVGFVYSFLMSFHSFLVWSKLYLLIQQEKQTP